VEHSSAVISPFHDQPKTDNGHFVSYLSMRPSFFHHLHPPTIPAPQARFRYTLGAGGLSFFMLVVVVITGALEMFYYIPTPDEAPLSIQTITFLVPFGGMIRNLHYWSAQILVIVAGVHMLRVILTGAYAPPRRFNYLIGMGLFLLCLFLDFTGYGLRWDQGVHWALVAGTNLIRAIPGIGGWLYELAVGGELGEATLVRFYTWHIFGLTLAIVVLVGWHIFRVRRDGGIAAPPPHLRQNPDRITRFELVQREMTAMILSLVVLVLLAAFAPAPLAASLQENTAVIADVRAPWFFLWVQQLLKLGDPFIFGVFIPAALFLALVLIPYLFKPTEPAELGKWLPRSGRAAQTLFASVLLAILILSLLALIPD
jgi:quinol-cytochrome oxidoreductase complex cytochrome b subunit